MTNKYKINLVLILAAESEDEARQDLLEEIDNPDSILFNTYVYGIRKMDDLDKEEMRRNEEE